MSHSFGCGSYVVFIYVRQIAFQFAHRRKQFVIKRRKLGNKSGFRKRRRTAYRRLLCREICAELRNVIGKSGYNILFCHIEHSKRFYIDYLTVVFECDFASRNRFLLGINTVTNKYVYIFLFKEYRHRIGCVFVVQKSSFRRFGFPIGAVAVKVENNTIMRL